MGKKEKGEETVERRRERNRRNEKSNRMEELIGGRRETCWKKNE